MQLLKSVMVSLSRAFHVNAIQKPVMMKSIQINTRLSNKAVQYNVREFSKQNLLVNMGERGVLGVRHLLMGLLFMALTVSGGTWWMAMHPSNYEGLSSMEKTWVNTIDLWIPNASNYFVSKTPSIIKKVVTITEGEPDPAVVKRKEMEALRIKMMNEALVSEISEGYSIDPDAALWMIEDSRASAAKYKEMDYILLLSITAVESGFNPFAFSVGVGARGLQQIYPKAHPEKMKRIEGAGGHILSIRDNYNTGAEVLNTYMRKFNGNVVLALQQYNGALKDPTRKYSTKVLNVYNRFQKKLQGPRNKWMELSKQ